MTDTEKQKPQHKSMLRQAYADSLGSQVYGYSLDGLYKKAHDDI